MSMTVRQLIEHLAQHDQDLEVKIRDKNIALILHDFPSHAVELEEFIDTQGGFLTAREILDKINSHEINSKMVVTLG